ncbi:MAG: o-succinylbenzoate synthase [Acidobacteriota bacterium]
MALERLILRGIRLPFVRPFQTSFGRTDEKIALLVELQGDGVSGWGECVAAEGPFFSPEDYWTAKHVITRFLGPALLESGEENPQALSRVWWRVRGHPMAKAALEAALWDWQARRRGVPLWRWIGGKRRRLPCGVSIGIQPSVDDLLRRIDEALEEGYRRVKIKIAPGWDVAVVGEVRRRFPELPLMADANGAYGSADADHLQRLDEFDLMMLEQPLSHEDLLEHARLARRLRTPICLDESVTSEHDARLALELGACRILNIKQGRLGGVAAARRVHDLCREAGVPVWCGGMLETGVGRALNVALSTLENFTLPGDVAASRRYFVRDTIVPPVEVVDGFIEVPERPGIGYEPDLEWIERITFERSVLERPTGVAS